VKLSILVTAIHACLRQRRTGAGIYPPVEEAGNSVSGCFNNLRRII